VILSIFGALVAIGAYQLIINKYYWGPKGAPTDDKKEKHGE
jgi:hypothetical protein